MHYAAGSAGHEHLTPGGDGGRAVAGARDRREGASSTRDEELLGVQHARTSHPPAATPRSAASRAGDGFKPWCGAARENIEVSSTWSTPHREGNPSADARPRHRQPQLLPRGGRRPALLWTTPLRPTRSRAPPATLKLIMDSLRYWVTEMHSTVPVRPGVHDGARAARRRSTVVVLRTSTRTPSSPHQAHRQPWTLARGATRSAIPVLWTEWKGATATGAAFWKVTWACRRPRLALTARPISTRGRRRRPTASITSSSPTMASACATW